MSSTHEGHRNRMRQRLRENGPDSLQDHELLEVLLYYAIPRGDTNPLAHRLLDTFGDLSGVLHADHEALMSVPGVGEQAASLLRILLPVYRRYLAVSGPKNKKKYETAADMATYFVPRFAELKEEQVQALYLDSRRCFIKSETLHKGAVGTVPVDVRRLAETSLNVKAAYVVLAHNHPSGLLLPSKQDEIVTIRVADMLTRLGVILLDHLIVGQGEYVSMAHSKEFRYLFSGDGDRGRTAT